MLNPLNENKVYLRYYIVIWIFVILIHGLILSFVSDIGKYLAFADSFIFNTIFAFIGFGIWYVVRFRRLDSAQVFNTIVTHLVASTFLISIWLFIGRGLITILFKNEDNYLGFFSDTVLWRGILGFLFYTIIAFNYYLLQYYREFQEQKLKESEINRLLKETELSALKSQINPHFIFNSLNSVSALTLSDPPKAQEMVINLSTFLRYMITPTTTQLIKLKEELNAVKLYLEIEQVRFGDKLNVEINCNEDLQDLKLPQLILQPLVENAIKYGVYESTETNMIGINCLKEKGFLSIEIVNDIEPDGVPGKGHGIGLKNVRSRLELVYGNPELMVVNKTDTKFSVKLTIPQ